MRNFIVPSLAFLGMTAGLLLGHARAQEPQKPKLPETTNTAPKTFTPRAADVSSVDNILAALYDVISGPAGKARDWDRMRSLFIPGARLMPTSPVRPAGTKPDAPLTGREDYATHVIDVEGYVERASKFFATEGFYEKEVARRTESYGHIVHAWSTYESRHKTDDATPFARGINSIQLMYDGKRWWVVGILWEGETPKTPLPAQYLSGGQK
ncbi:MAG TPA: hypothetical protein VLJ61_10800 [Pyrinomonadaceae bacterium]|nr:hypothetical protein [Pyrinomonadaceae bacterium]